MKNIWQSILLLSVIAVIVSVACYVVHYKTQEAIAKSCVNNGQFEVGGYTYGCWLVASTLPKEFQ